ncbi:serine protease [Nitrospina watsonii]|uniref:TPR_REGION domain-containing protein n=1 Tax=Nitrospina watsonii TaxID=1323948 RepID=A0ABN8VYR4_9BACT|nr:serine protease [Nitrospina watsonii]CAI2718904.1 TPR_REGION domain-containing protein [Nitrospina watsonii]
MHFLPRSFKPLVAIVLVTLLGFGGVTVVSAYEANRNAVVMLIAKDAQGETLATGTGFIVRPDGTLITNYHVLIDAVSMNAVFPDGTQIGVMGILNTDRARDVAVLKLEGDLYSTLELGDSTSLQAFDYLSALGYPSHAVEMVEEGLRGVLVQTYGFVLGVHPQAIPDYPFIYATTPFEPGFSGGPVMNMDNQVVGVATLEGRALNLAVPIQYVTPYLNTTKLLSFEELRKRDRNAKEVFYYRGNSTLYGLGDTQAAIELFGKTLRIDPNFVPARYDLAVAYRGLGQAEDAIAEYEKALQLNPRFPEALSNLGGQYFRQGDVDKAIEQFKQAIAIYPNFIQALSNLGAALNKQQQFDQSVPYLKRALSLDPEFGVAYFNLGNAYHGLGKSQEAIEAYHTAVNMGVDFLSLHWNLHDIHSKQGDREQALRELRIILQLDPQNEDARRKLEALDSRP